MISESPVTAEPNNKFLNERYIRKSFVLFFMVLLGVAVDQYVKYVIFARAILPLGLTHFLNYRFAFSIPLPIWFIYVLYILVLGVAVYFFSKQFFRSGAIELIGWTLLFAGGFSNIGERMALGYVRDYFVILNGIFNLADFFIIAGIIILLFNKKS